MIVGDSAKSLVICDFDGTISALDMGNAVLNRFTKDGWQVIDEAYCAGRIGSREAYERVSGLWQADRAELAGFVQTQGRIDPYFPGFYDRCRRVGLDAIIVSDGLNFYIEAILRQFHLSGLSFFSNHVQFEDNGRIVITFPEWNPDCDRCGTCKRNIVRRCRQTYERIIYVGNGHSDVCPAKEADVVFAKEILYEKCLGDGTPCIGYDSFKDVGDCLFAGLPVRSLGA